ncbi:hypothetical protein V500_03958 [Pseudogymnoascus sp. VKM F-4518 (FW-2643)]|nr:hypothetical protein V500_03958 [Pseudogymnoascus sp. VKM F-4518 (FW-2643)]
MATQVDTIRTGFPMPNFARTSSYGKGITISRAADEKSKEMHNNTNRVPVDFTKFYGIKPTNVDRRFDLILSDLSYLPKVNKPRADWVVTAALNAFRAYQSGGFNTVRRFATVGTGSGTDVIAALDTFPALDSVALTDMHDEVVNIAKLNVLSATERSEWSIRDIAQRSVARAGDLLLPLRGEEQFDLIYENLPNIPLPNQGNLKNGQTSSTYVGDRSTDRIPATVSAALLELHYVCLVEAKAFGLINPSGSVLSSVGGRVTLVDILSMADLAGYTARILTLSWKEQSEPESVIGGYADQEEKSGREFYFYPVAILEAVFEGRTPAGAGLCAEQIEQELVAKRLCATEALRKHQQGMKIGHTVVVVASTPKRA